MKTGKLDTAPHCPTCDKTLDGFTSFEEHSPGPEDITVCCYCGEVLQFTEEMALEKISDEVMAELDPECRDSLMLAKNAAALYGAVSNSIKS